MTIVRALACCSLQCLSLCILEFCLSRVDTFTFPRYCFLHCISTPASRRRICCWEELTCANIRFDIVVADILIHIIPLVKVRLS
jgi:hypothetical protein